jgi:hypothetical protein
LAPGFAAPDLPDARRTAWPERPAGGESLQMRRKLLVRLKTQPTVCKFRVQFGLSAG